MSEKNKAESNERCEEAPVIEFAGKEDCPGIVEVDRDRMMQRFEEHNVAMREFITEEELKKWEERVGDAGQMTLVLKNTDEVAGYIHFEKRPKDLKDLENPKDVLFVGTLSLIRKYQGRGLALGLLKRGEEEAKKAFNPKKLRAGVILENLPAVKFWTGKKKAGYKQIGKPVPRVDKDGNPILWDGKPSHSIMVEKDLG